MLLLVRWLGWKLSDSFGVCHYNSVQIFSVPRNGGERAALTTSFFRTLGKLLGGSNSSYCYWCAENVDMTKTLSGLTPHSHHSDRTETKKLTHVGIHYWRLTNTNELRTFKNLSIFVLSGSFCGIELTKVTKSIHTEINCHSTTSTKAVTVLVIFYLCNYW